MKIQWLYGSLKRDIESVESMLERSIQTHEPIIREACTHLLQSGGKRIRPVFVLVCGKMNGEVSEDLIKTATTLELIHMASLVHDDVIDDAELRRGKQTVRSQWDNKIAMYTGDYLFAKSLELLSDIESPDIHRVLAKTIEEVCLGEIEQIRDKYNWDQNLRCYLRRIARKTAILISASCEMGGIVAGLSKKDIRRLKLYGYYVGMSFQIIDDILDFISTEKELGKPAGGDLLQGNVTLPVIYALRDETLKSKIHSVHAHVSEEEYAPIVEAIRSSHYIAYSYKLSERYLQKALQVIEPLPSSHSKKTLQSIAQYIGKRKK